MGHLSIAKVRLMSPRSRQGSALKGCLIALGILLILLVGVGAFVYMNWKGWTASAIRSATTQAVQDSKLTQPDKDKIVKKVDSVMTDFEAGKVSVEQLGKVAEELAKGPLLPLTAVNGIEQEYFTLPGLTDEDRAAGKRAIDRAARGIAEKKIPQTKLDDLLAPIADRNPNGGFQLRPKDQVTAEDVKKLIEIAKTEADAAQIPDEPFTVDIATEVVDAIDRVLGVPPSK